MQYCSTLTLSLELWEMRLNVCWLFFWGVPVRCAFRMFWWRVLLGCSSAVCSWDVLVPCTFRVFWCGVIFWCCSAQAPQYLGYWKEWTVKFNWDVRMVLIQHLFFCLAVVLFDERSAVDIIKMMLQDYTKCSVQIWKKDFLLWLYCQVVHLKPQKCCSAPLGTWETPFTSQWGHRLEERTGGTRMTYGTARMSCQNYHDWKVLPGLGRHSGTV